MARPIQSSIVVPLSHRVARLLLLLVALLLSGRELPAQLEGKIAEKPLVVWYARGVGPEQVMGYASDLMKRLDMKGFMLEQLETERNSDRIADIIPKTEEPLYGAATYMVTGLVPSFTSISFQQVVDEADARRLVEGRRKQFGDQATLEESGNGCFTVLYKYSYSFEMPEGQDESNFATAASTAGSTNWKNEFSFSEKDGKKMVDQTTTSTFWFRYHDEMLYESSFADLFTMILPSASDITSGIDSSTDLGFDAYFDRVPQGIRTLGWNLLSSAVGTQLQQHDGEADASYNARRTGGDLGLALVQTLLFDVDHSEGWLRYASADEPSLRGELRVRARNNSALSKQLMETAGASRFAPILSDNAAITMHLCARLPEEAPTALVALGDWIDHEVSLADSGATAIDKEGASMVVEMLKGIAEHRNLEMILKIGWSLESNGVIYGGLHLHDQPTLLDKMYEVFTEDDTEFRQLMQVIEVDGLRFLRIQFPSDATDGMRSELGVTLTHVYLAMDNSCLWFAIGSENAHDIIRQSIARCSENGRAARTPLVSMKIDMERWLSYPQDDPTGIAQMPWFLDENAWWFPPNPISAFAMFNSLDQKPTPIMGRVFDLGGAQQFWLTLESDESGILLKTSLGLALANHMIARMIDSQDQMMRDNNAVISQPVEPTPVEATPVELEPVPSP